MGFGCNVPAIMATRTIESRNSRLLTMLVNPLMSCSARLPVYMLFIGIFFNKYAGFAMFGLYLTGIVLAIIMARLMKRFLIKGEDVPFVMELPPYRIPTLKSIFRHMWEKASQYLRKMGGIILIASIIIWFLGYFPRSSDPEMQESNSYIGKIGQTIQPVMKPLGFDWKISVGLVSGMAAKEVVVSTLGILYGTADEEALPQRIEEATYADGTPVFTPLVALSLMLFVLIYFPCIATVAAIKNESGSWKWAGFVILYTTTLAWFVSFVVYQVGSLLI
jgi:ferrous iron transport protein B